MLRRPVLPLLLLFLSSLSGACAIPGDAAWSDLHSTLQAGGIDSSASGSITANLAGTFPDVGSGSLELPEEDASSRYLAGRLGFAPLEFVFSDFSHQSTHKSSLDFPALNASGDFETQLDLSVQKLLLGFDLVNTPVSRVGVLLGVDFLEFNNFEIALANPPAGYSGQSSYPLVSDQTLPVPLLGLRGDVLLPGTGLRAGGEVCGFYLSDLEDLDKMEYLDVDLNLSWSRGNWLEWTLGYRQIGFDLEGAIEGETLTADIEVSGPYLNFGVIW